MRIIAGKHKGRQVIAPHGLITRPTVSKAREALFAMLQTRPPDLAGCDFLDLYAGSGAIGLEACSRGAATVLLIDKSAAALDAARRNIEQFGEKERVATLRADATRLGQAHVKFNIAFMDPPYRLGLVAPTLNALIKGGWLTPDSLVIAEVGSRETLPAHPLFSLIEERVYGAARLIFLRPD